MSHDISQEALERLRDAAGADPIAGAVVLGSGLGVLLETWQPVLRIAGDELPGLPRSTVAGHAGQVALVRFGGQSVLVFQGRVHFYEGYDRSQVTYGVRLAAALGARWLLLSNASGACDAMITPGTILVIEDHFHLFLGMRAARGAGRGAPRSGSPYHPRRTEELFRALGRAGLRTVRGVLYGGTGPNYETAAEIEMIRRLGAQAACMSTVIEAEEGNRLGLEVAALSLVTNLGTGLAAGPLEHAEVVARGQEVGPELAQAIDLLVRDWCRAAPRGR